MLTPPGKNPRDWAARGGSLYSALVMAEKYANHPLMPQMAPRIEAARPAMRSILAEGTLHEAFYAFFDKYEETPGFEAMGPAGAPEEGDPVFGPLWARLVEGEALLRLVTDESWKIDKVHVMFATGPVPSGIPDLIEAWAALMPEPEAEPT